jgi:hypothetical protein
VSLWHLQQGQLQDHRLLRLQEAVEARLILLRRKL